jgi:hypothetical protein
MVQQEDEHEGVGPLLFSDATLWQVIATLTPLLIWDCII